MTEGMAIELAAQLMKEEGSEYVFRYRHLQLLPLSKRTLRAYNELIIVIRPELTLRVSSKAGVLDLSDPRINEMQYVHRGQVILENPSTEEVLHIKFLQVIPKLNNPENAPEK